jgi:hypothetical protein
MHLFAVVVGFLPKAEKFPACRFMTASRPSPPTKASTGNFRFGSKRVEGATTAFRQNAAIAGDAADGHQGSELGHLI